jgi:hypothetical protein
MGGTDKLAVEASQPLIIRLRILVGHANMISMLMEGLAVAEETYKGWSDARKTDQRSIEAESHMVTYIEYRNENSVRDLDHADTMKGCQASSIV